MQQNCCINIHEMVMVCKLHNADYEEKLNFVNCTLYAGETDPALILFSN
jgi:hypothetical protein